MREEVMLMRMSIEHLRLLLAFSLLFVLSFEVFPQHSYFRQITDDDGLPGNDIYDMIYSDDGFLWFASDNGVSRYDGNIFKNFLVEDGLSENTIVKLHKDYLGRIWFLAYNGTLSFYDDGMIHPYRFNDSIIKYFPDNYLNKIYVDPSGTLVFSPRQGGKACIDKFGYTSPFISRNPGKYTDSCFLVFEDKADDHFLTIQKSKPEGYNHNGPLYYRADQYFLKVKYDGRQFHRNYIKTGPGEYLVSYRNCVFYIRDRKLVLRKTFPDEVLSIFEDNTGKLWVSVKFDHGLYRFDNLMMEDEPEHYFKGNTITGIMQDPEEGYWFSTEGYGVYYTPGFDFNTFMIPGNNRKLYVMALAVSGNRLWFSTRDTEIYSARIGEGMVRDFRKLPVPEPNTWIKHIVIDHEGYLWLSYSQHLRYDPAGFARPPDTLIHSEYISKGWGDTIMIGAKKPAYYYGNELVRFVGPDSIDRIYSSCHFDDQVYFGTLYGLYTYSKGHVYSYGHKSDMLNDRINCINYAGDYLVVCTAKHGIAFIRGDSVEFTLTENEGLLDNTVKSILVQNDTSLWIGTKRGLNRILLNENPSEIKIESYSSSDGLRADEINGMAMHDGYIWLATENGLASFNPATLKPHIQPPIININGVQINGKDTVLLDEYVLAHDQNHIRISFSGITYRMSGKVRYRYVMSGYTDQATLTNNNWKSFPNIPPGKYTFKVNAGNTHNIWNEHPKTIKFTIKKHYTQSLLFLISLIILSSAFMVGLSIFIQRQKKIKQRARREMAMMEQKLFRLQMNPHFVFNALLAIQGFMYQKNIHDAGRYLTSFAKLIRHTLYGSREDLVPLKNELEAMKYYLELQRLRFNNNFDFKIGIGDNIFTESIHIPPLLIQPFLENAIEHGIQHLKEGGLLNLRIRQENNMLIIEIEDNGIGREASMKLHLKKGKLHKSLGMEIVHSRLESLRKVIGKKISLDVSDLKNEDGSVRGTLVTISMQVY
ncbi:MAG: two-component regulator propeller domain-containing protein [Bacteroidales bacterium]|nr:two-component regulator propeller domain-containing protein [Bacteroidales bacterium]